MWPQVNFTHALSVPRDRKAFLCRAGMQKLSRPQQHWHATYFNTEQHPKSQDETYKKWTQWVGWDGLGGTCHQTWHNLKEQESKCGRTCLQYQLYETHNMGYNEIPAHLVGVGWRKGLVKIGRCLSFRASLVYQASPWQVKATVRSCLKNE